MRRGFEAQVFAAGHAFELAAGGDVSGAVGLLFGARIHVLHPVTKRTAGTGQEAAAAMWRNVDSY